MDHPLVSVVIPTFDRLDDVTVAVECALEQSWPAAAMEIIVVDDGSGDGTTAALAGRFGDRIRVLRKPNGGVSSARNLGLAAARGDYFALLDSDDEWLPSKLAKQVDFLEEHPDHGMVLTDVVCMDEQRIGGQVLRRRDQLASDGWQLTRVLRNPSLVASSALITREAFEEVGGFDESLPTAEDLDFHLRMAMHWKIGVIEEPLTRQMRGRPGGLATLPRHPQDQLDVVERFVRDHAHIIDTADCDAALLAAYVRNAQDLLDGGDLGGALRCAARSARLMLTARLRWPWASPQQLGPMR